VKENMKRHGETNALDVAKLTKRFGSYTAVDEVSFSVKGGEILVFSAPTAQAKQPP
jgi:ABC-type multidrug transport system ATPase subunit